MQGFVVPHSHNRGRDPWVEYVLPADNRCPAPPLAVEAKAAPSAPAVWFAPGADDLSRMPEKARLFDDAFHGISTGEWPDSKKKRPKTKSSGKPEFRDLGLALHREQEAILREIRDEGFVWLGGDNNGHYIPAFTELGHRTKLAGGHVIRRIVAMTERKPLSGRDKGAIERELRKEAAMLAEYVVLNPRVRGCIRVDNDLVFKSWADVHSWLFWLLEEGVIPCLPHLAVAERSADGSVYHPHFLILLPVGDEVHWDRRKRGGQRGLFRAVMNGWTRALKGDPGGIKNALKIKSPISPKMATAIFNQHKYLTLREMAESLDCRRFDDRRAAQEDSSLGKVSNEIFTETRAVAWPAVTKMADLGDPRYPKWVADRKMLCSGLFESLIPAALARWSGDNTPNSIRCVVWHVCKRVARDWDPARVSPPPDRGVMDLPDELELKAKQRLAGKWSAFGVLAETLDEMADEISKIEATGRAATKADLKETQRWSKATVDRRFDDAVLVSYYKPHPVSGKKETNTSDQSAAEHAHTGTSVNHRLVALVLPTSSFVDQSEFQQDRSALARATVDRKPDLTIPFLGPCSSVSYHEAGDSNVRRSSTNIGSEGRSSGLATVLRDPTATEGRSQSPDSSRINPACRHDSGCQQVANGCARSITDGWHPTPILETTGRNRPLLERGNPSSLDVPA